MIAAELASSAPTKGRTQLARGVALILFACLGCAVGSNGVTRMADGVRYEGRYVNPEAYAAYLLGVEKEARGELAEALTSYLEAHAEDPDSPEIWARIGAVRCFSNEPQAGPGAARAAFERGLKLDPTYYGNYLERARCAERARDLSRALGDATAAVSRRPQDETANLLVARLLSALGKGREARAWLEAYRSYHAGTIATERALQNARAQSSGGSAPAEEHPTAVAASSGAFTELRMGRPERASQQARTELEADPSNADAWIASLVACDALHDEACFESTLGQLRAPSLPPSNLALGYLRELLVRRAGAQVSF